MTLVNVFTVQPEHRHELIDVLAGATAAMLQIEVSSRRTCTAAATGDGRRVVNDVQRRSAEHVEAMLTDPRAIPHMQRAAELASYDPIVTDVAYVGHA